MSDVVVKQFTFAISSPNELFVLIRSQQDVSSHAHITPLTTRASLLPSSACGTSYRLN